MNTEEFTVNNEVEPLQPQPEKKSMCSHISCNALFNCALASALIVLYILYFTTPKPQLFVPKEITGEPGSGEIVFVNLDTINANYALVAILTGDIQAEMARQEAIFANKEKTFERKYNQFQENMNAGVLTQVQAEYSQKQLMQEYQMLEADKERVFNDLQMRQTAALAQIYDSLQSAVRRINAERNASFVITYQNQSPFLLLTDPARDITDYVLFELNRSYKYKK